MSNLHEIVSRVQPDDWIITEELDEKTGEMFTVQTAKPGTAAEEFCNALMESMK